MFKRLSSFARLVVDHKKKFFTRLFDTHTHTCIRFKMGLHVKQSEKESTTHKELRNVYLFDSDG
jgi:hypothetical protein